MTGLFKKIKNLYNRLNTRMATLGIMVGATVTSNKLTMQYYGDPLYHLSGFISAGIASAIDHVSTMPMIKLTNDDPNFKKFGLDKRFEETNPIIGKHPTMGEYYKKSTVNTLIQLIAGSVYPPVGHAYLIASPMIASHNKGVYNSLKSELETVKPVGNIIEEILRKESELITLSGIDQ